MIRKVFEYIIVCDNPTCVEGGHAYSSQTAADCAESATKYGWRQVSARRWLCPRCKEEAERLASNER